jgi:23S rRNA (uracil1939-C5)-methyltransferase
MSEHVVDIERMCYGGAGLGRIEGKVCFTHLTAPGDRARVGVSREKKSFIEAELVEIFQPSSHRVTPVCPWFGTCGGCNWQHLSYEEQLKQKREIFAETLHRLGGVEGIEVLPTLGSEPFGYRSRIQLKVTTGNPGVRVGFYRNGTHEVVDLPSGCPIAHPVLNCVLAEFRALLVRLPEAAQVPQVDLAMGDDGQCIAVVQWRDRRTPWRKMSLTCARRFPWLPAFSSVTPVAPR